jgi:hypothetical protein
MPVARGGNRLKCTVKSGVADVDWIELKPAEKEQRVTSGVTPGLSTAQ